MAKDTTSKPEEVPNPKVKVVYIGPCTTTDKKLGGMFLPIAEGGEVAELWAEEFAAYL